MNLERAKELQENITRETVSLIVLLGTAANTALWTQTISLIGKAWCIAPEITQEALDIVKSEWAYAEAGSEQHVYPDSELPINATGNQTLNNVWDLFETAVQLSDIAERQALLDIAHELAECQVLLDWIVLSPAEKKEIQAIINDTK